jgi:hypothetical protein
MTVQRSFVNELGNQIKITIEGPDSTSENTLTKMEAMHLCDALARALLSKECIQTSDALASPSAEAAQPVADIDTLEQELFDAVRPYLSGVSDHHGVKAEIYTVLSLALSQPQGELREALTQVEGACLRIEMVSQAMRKGDPSSGLLNEAVATIRAALAGRTAG